MIWQEARAISKNLTVQFENVVYQIQTERPTYTLRNAGVTVCVDAQQNITLLYKGKSLPYNVFHTCTPEKASGRCGVRRKCKQKKQSEVVLAKDLNQTINTKSAPVPHKPTPDHPWRTFSLSASRKRVTF